jgi:ABC-type transport system involved in multi-copper enzyme maturation permease subunit
MILFIIVCCFLFAGAVMSFITLYGMNDESIVYETSVENRYQAFKSIIFTRRLATISGIIGVIGFLLTIGSFVDHTKHPSFSPGYQRGQVDAINGIINFDSYVIYHDSVPVDTVYFYTGEKLKK